MDLRGSRTGFRFSIANHTGDNKIRVIHDRTERDSQGITQFTTLMNRTGSFCIDMAVEREEKEVSNMSTRSKPQPQASRSRYLGSPALVLKVEMS